MGDKSTRISEAVDNLEATASRTRFPNIRLQDIDTTISRPAFLVQLDNTETVTSGNILTIPWDSKVVDTDSMWNLATSTYVTVRTAGLWHVGLSAYWTEFSGIATRVLTSVFNGVGTALTDLICRDERYAAVTTIPGAAPSSLVSLGIGDTIEGRVYQNSGGNEGLENTITHMWGYLITPN